jgi:hypothetical protein
MMRINSFVLAFWLSSTLGFAQTLEIVNNQPFDIRQPYTLRGVKLLAGAAPAALAQPDGDDTVAMIEVQASQTKKIELSGQNSDAAAQPNENAVSLKADGDGIAISAGQKDMGKMTWGVLVGPAPKKEKEPKPTEQDFAAAFKPVPLKFAQVGEGGALFKTWKASGSEAGLKLDVVIRAYNTGFLDADVTYANESAPTKDVYAAVICKWQQPNASSRTLCYDNRRQKLDDGDYSPFRTAGEGRHNFVLRGVDWINTKFDGGASAVWYNDFTPSFTYHRQASAPDKKVPLPARWVGANTAQLGQEAQANEGAIYSITEIARPNVSTYAARLEDNILPPPGQSLTIRSRIAFDGFAITDDRADQNFVAYVGYNPQQVTTIGGKITFGVPFTKMGTNYFPYSTLGENFGQMRMAGMSKEGYWPLAPQTVNQWPLFADDIKRDLRILKSMGFELVRLHHLELLWDKDKSGKPYVEPAKRWEYLDFFFGELEKLQLKALLDVKLTPDEVAELVTRYRKLADGVEYDNEVLLFQTPVPDIPVWKAVYDAVKRVAPEMPFHLTVHTNTGAFDRIAEEGVKFDRVGQHAYMDSPDAIPTARDNALAVANYAAKHNKEPLITEWNWRFMTRMSFEDRAKIYPPIFENVLASRCMPIFYQFQYQDSLAMNPNGLKGIRRYELLLLSRRPKPEAIRLMKLIEKYASPESGVRKIDISRRIAQLAGNSKDIMFEVTNLTDAPMPVVMDVESSSEMKATINGRRETVLQPRKKMQVPITAALIDPEKALPGFYHVFLRVQAADDTLRYGWAEIRRPGNVTMDKNQSGNVAYAKGAVDFDFNRPLTVVYPDSATIPELEATWTVFITLESATGRPVEIYTAGDLAKKGGEGNRTIVLVTREKDAKPSVRVENDGRKLVVSGASDADVMAACMDFTLRYWKNAKDSGARKIGLVPAASPAEAGGKTDVD